MNEQLQEYIKGYLAKGLSRDVIKNNLLSLGWNESDIEATLKQLTSSVQMPTNQALSSPEIALKKEAPPSNLPTTVSFKWWPILIIVCLIILVIVMIFNGKANLFASKNVQIAASLPVDLHEKYFPVWQQLFMEKNKITQDYFTAHIFPKETSLNKNAELGEQLYIKYDYQIDWMTMPFMDGIVIKPSGEDHYYSLEELKTQATSGKNENYNPWAQEALFYQLHEIIQADHIISKNEVDKKLAACDSNIKPAPKPLAISDFFMSDNFSKKRLLYRGITKLKNNTYKIGEIDLVTGETSCQEVPSASSLF